MYPDSVFKDKKVCIVGPASYIENIKQRYKIEKYDVVIRLIRSLPVPKRLLENIGNKTNAVSSSLVGDRGLDLDKGKDSKDLKTILDNGKILIVPVIGEGYGNAWRAKLIKSQTERQITKISSLSPDIEIIQVNLGYFKQYRDELDTNPSTGLATVCQLLSYPVSELYITGFTFDVHNCPYIHEYLDRCIGDGKKIDESGWHDGKKEVAFFKKLFLRDSRINPDAYIKEKVLELK